MVFNEDTRKILTYIRLMPVIFFFVTVICFSLIYIHITNNFKIEWTKNERNDEVLSIQNDIKKETLAAYEFIVNERLKSKLEIRDFIDKSAEIASLEFTNYLHNKVFLETREKEFIHEIIKLICSDNTDGCLFMREKNLVKLNVISKEDVKNQLKDLIVHKPESEYLEKILYNEDLDAYVSIKIKHAPIKEFYINRALKNLREMTTKDDNYIFVLSSDGTILSHGIKERIGNNIYNPNNPVQNATRTIIPFAHKEGEGFISYHFNPEDKLPLNEIKLSYIKYDKEWDLIIGYGKHLSEIENNIQQNLIKIEESYEKLALTQIYILLIIMIFAVAIANYLIKKAKNKFAKFANDNLEEHNRLKKILHSQNALIFNQSEAINEFVPTASLNTKWQFENTTKKMLSILAIDNEEYIIGVNLLEFFTHGEKRKILEAMNYFDNSQEINDKHKTYKIDKCRATKFNGSNVWLSLTISKELASTVEGKEDGYTIVANVIEEEIKLQHKIDEEIKKNLEKENIYFQQSKMAALGEVVKMITHQWKQPLAQIGGETASFIKLVRKNKTQDNLIKLNYVQDYIEKIEDIGVFMSNTISDFNNFYDAREDEYINFNVLDTIKAIINILIPTASSKIYDIKYEGDLDAQAYGSIGLYQQIIFTIVTNAIEAFNERNTKDNRMLKFTINKIENTTQLLIEDNAGGIPEDILPSIFEPKFSTKKKNGTSNSGMGLWMTKKSLEEKFVNGNIVATNKNNGVEFKIETGKN